MAPRVQRLRDAHEARSGAGIRLGDRLLESWGSQSSVCRLKTANSVYRDLDSMRAGSKIFINKPLMPIRRWTVWQAINSFIRDLFITRAEGGIHFHKLEHAVRGDADANTPRCLGMLRPLRVVITNLRLQAARGPLRGGRGQGELRNRIQVIGFS